MYNHYLLSVSQIKTYRFSDWATSWTLLLDHLCYFCLVLLCFRAHLSIDAFWSPAGKWLTSWFSFVMSNCEVSLSHWYPGPGVVLDCIDS